MTNDVNEKCKTQWLTPKQAASYLQIALGTLRNWTSARYVPHAKRGNVVRYHRDELDRWLSAGRCRGRRTFADDEATRTDSGA